VCLLTECCNETNICSSYDCASTAGYVPRRGQDSITCKTKRCNADECCVKTSTCEQFACRNGFLPKARLSDVTCATKKCKTAECCDVNTNTCVGHQCQPGYWNKTGADQLFCNADGKCEDKVCCKRTG
jgi:hypothetical protein